MDAFWVILGIFILGLGFLDILLTILNYDEAGFLATRLCELQWRGIRRITRRMSRRWRPIALRQVTGLQVMLCVATWLGCVVLGFGFIYYGMMEGANFQYDGPNIGANMFSAMYLSSAQLSTVGTSQLSPETDVLRLLTIAETLSAPLLITLILTFLLGVYQVIRDLRTLSSNFSSAELGAGDPISNLAPYFPNGQATGLDGYLQTIHDGFWSYADGLRLHHIAYYFQSGRDQFSLPYTLHMMSGTLAALRFGLPTNHPASLQPLLPRLITQFGQFADYLHNELSWTSTAVPEIVSFEDFSAAFAGTSNGTHKATDLWLNRFFRLTRNMALLAKIETKEDPQQAYDRYQKWLPFAYRAEQVSAAVSRDLDYQPVGLSSDAPKINTKKTHGMPARERILARPWQVFVNRWLAVPDPGFTRLRAATGAILAAAAAVISLYILFHFASLPVLPATIFGGIIGMYAATMPNDLKTADRKLTTLLMIVPAVFAAIVGALVASSFVLSAVALVIIALLGVWVGGFGLRFAALGQLAFMGFYFSLLLNPHLDQLPAFAIAAIIGAIWAYLFRFVLIAEQPNQVLQSGLDVFRARLVLMLNSLIDAVSAARWDPDVRKRVSADLNQLHRCAAFLQGQLRVMDAASTGSDLQPDALRLLVFDAELAASNVTTAAQEFARAGAAVPIVTRGQLAGMLAQAQEQLRHKSSKEILQLSPATPPENWSERARRLHAAIRELLRTANTLQNAHTVVLTSSLLTNAHTAKVNKDVSISSATHSTTLNAEKPNIGFRSSASRLAIQAAVATGLALLAGAAVTTAHQYWAALAAFVVLGGTSTIEETKEKGIQRIIGTFLGAVIGFGLTKLTGTNPFVVSPLLVICVFAMMYLGPVSQALNVFWMTMMLSLLYEFLGTLTTETLQVRVMETIIGAVIALGISILLLPSRSRQKVNVDAIALLNTLDDIIETCLKRLSGEKNIPSPTHKVLVLDQQFRQLSTRAEPLRSAPGALSLDGIERRLTATGALTYYARHLIKTTESCVRSEGPLEANVTEQFATITHDNISALIQVLNKELPSLIHGSEDFPLQSETSSSSSEAVQYLVRINQTLLTIIEDMRPDTAETIQTESSQDVTTPAIVP